MPPPATERPRPPRRGSASPLPVIGDGPGPERRGIARSRSGRRRALVLLAVHLLIAAHIAHWWLTGSSLSPLEPSEGMEITKHGVVNAGLVFFAATILLTAVFGRFFCGWACHLVALQDGCRWLLGRIGIRPRPLRSRLLALVPFGAFAYMFLWPFAARWWAGEGAPELTLAFTKSDFWATFPGWGVALVTFAVCGFATVYFLGSKGFCTYACPYGAIFGVADKLAPWRIRVSDACEGCGHCTAVCSSNVRVHEEVATWGMVVDSGCMKCLDCVSVCPNDALSWAAGRPALFARRRGGAKPRRLGRSLPWGEEAVLAVAFVACFGAIRGIYGLVPFLLALGASGVVAFLVLVLVRLARRRSLGLAGVVLKRGGRMQPAGWAFAGAMGLLLLLLAHSGAVQWQSWRGRALAGRVAEAMAGRPGEEAAGGARRDAEAALAHLDRAQRWGLVDDPRLEVEVASLHLATGREDLFLHHAGRALAAAPRNRALRLELAAYHAARGRRGEAAALYEEVLAIDPDSWRAALGLGLARAGQRRLGAAGEAFAAGLAVAPEVAELHYNLALVEARRGRVAAAEAGFRRALERRPEYLEARENLAGLLCAQGRFREGLAEFERVVERGEADAATHLLMARAALALGDAGRAGDEARRALELEPGLVPARELLRAAGLGSARGG